MEQNVREFGRKTAGYAGSTSLSLLLRAGPPRKIDEDF
jgi:hypothetical protein